MKDLIERQTAIEAVEHITSNMSVCVNTDECHGMKRMQRQAVIELANLPSAQPEQRWIPCSERLPKRGKDVLVTRHYLGEEDNNKSCYYTEVAARYGDDDNPDWISYSDEYKIHPKNHIVIAWQELPEPYKGEMNEKCG